MGFKRDFSQQTGTSAVLDMVQLVCELTHSFCEVRKWKLPCSASSCIL